MDCGRNNMSDSVYNISIDRQVIKLLGEHLYGDTPSVINELIANAHDARANRVWISIKTETPYEIEIQDDGIGMTIDDINNYYLNIGYNRRSAVDLQESLLKYDHRDDMGQKGIGKLSVFALSKNVDLISLRNSELVGCNMDFDVICSSNDGQPTPITNPIIDMDKLSDEKTGTRIILHDVSKDLSKSYKFIKNSILRSFVLNDGRMKVFIRKNDEEFTEIKRESFCAYGQIDTLVTIGSGFDNLIKKVNDNDIESCYKHIFTYDEMVIATKNERKNKVIDPLPIELKVFNKDRTKQVDYSFKFTGWIGTVRDAESFREILRENGYTDEEIESKEIVTIDDNRISVFSRGKVGEYNILPKLKTKAANDAYLIGEIFVDDFENEQLIDMATSNRRGYQEDDPRYEALVKNLKLIVSKVVNAKQVINKKRKEDEEQKEANEIKQTFFEGQNKSSHVFEDLSDKDKEDIEDDFKQFSRAVSLGYKTKKMTHLLISHKQDEVTTYGNFLIDLILSMNPDLKSIITFTSNPEFSIKKGKNIFDELKGCFRPDYYVVFLFTKSFYDSNACLAEAGAAWATNTQYMNFPIDIGFSDIDKPLDNMKSGSQYLFNTEEQLKDFCLAVQSILSAIDTTYPVDNIISEAKRLLGSGKYIFSVPTYIPKRKFQALPVCQNCKRPMYIKNLKEDDLEYSCKCGKGSIANEVIIY